MALCLFMGNLHAASAAGWCRPRSAAPGQALLAWLRLARWFRCEHIAGHAARDSLNMGRCPIPKNLLASPLDNRY